MDLNNLSHHYENFEIKSQIINNDIDINNLIIDNKSQNIGFKVGKSIILLLWSNIILYIWRINIQFIKK